MSKFQAVLIPADITKPLQDVEISDYKEIAKTIGAQHFDVFRTPDPTCELYIDDEGAVNGSERNTRAALLMSAAHNVFAVMYVFGDALLVGGVDAEGETQSVTPEWREAINDVQKECMGII